MIGNRYEKEFIAAIKTDVNSIEGVRGCYDLILNSYGHNKNIGSLHIGVNDDLTAKQIQAIETKITTLLYEKYNTIITVGIYAENMSDEASRRVFESVLKVIKAFPHVLQIHGFYLDEESKKIRFDLVVSFDDPAPMETIRAIKEETETLNEGYTAFVQYDQDFSLSE